MIVGLALFAVLATASRGLPPANELARRYGDAVVTVDDASDAAPAAQGFFVSSSGLLCTVLPGAVVGDRVDVVGSERWSGSVVAVDDDGLALVLAVIDPLTPVAALGLSSDGQRSLWLVGLQRGPRGVSAVVGGEEPQGLLLPVPRGAPVLDDRGVVVAVARRSKGGGAITVVDVAKLRALAKTYATTTTTTASTKR